MVFSALCASGMLGTALDSDKKMAVILWGTYPTLFLESKQIGIFVDAACVSIFFVPHRSHLLLQIPLPISMSYLLQVRLKWGWIEIRYPTKTKILKYKKSFIRTPMDFESHQPCQSTKVNFEIYLYGSLELWRSKINAQCGPRWSSGSW